MHNEYEDRVGTGKGKIKGHFPVHMHWRRLGKWKLSVAVS